MGGFFKGWRRKAGCVTLVMTLAFMGGLIRSLSITEEVNFASSPYSIEVIRSQDGHIIWVSHSDLASPYVPRFPQWFSGEFHELHTFFVDPEIAWRTRSWLFAAGSLGQWTIFWVIPYWLIVLPLTLLSAYLLLVKPQVAKPQKTVEPDGA